MHVFWGMKKLVQLKFVQLLLLNMVKGKMIKNCAAQGFYCASRGLTVVQKYKKSAIDVMNITNSDI